MTTIGGKNPNQPTIDPVPKKTEAAAPISETDKTKINNIVEKSLKQDDPLSQKSSKVSLSETIAESKLEKQFAEQKKILLTTFKNVESYIDIFNKLNNSNAAKSNIPEFKEQIEIIIKKNSPITLEDISLFWNKIQDTMTDPGSISYDMNQAIVRRDMTFKVSPQLEVLNKLLNDTNPSPNLQKELENIDLEAYKLCNQYADVITSIDSNIINNVNLIIELINYRLNYLIKNLSNLLNEHEKISKNPEIEDIAVHLLENKIENLKKDILSATDQMMMFKNLNNATLEDISTNAVFTLEIINQLSNKFTPDTQIEIEKIKIKIFESLKAYLDSSISMATSVISNIISGTDNSIDIDYTKSILEKIYTHIKQIEGLNIDQKKLDASKIEFNIDKEIKDIKEKFKNLTSSLEYRISTLRDDLGMGG